MCAKSETAAPTTIAVRFSKSQMAIIWPGLAFVLSAYRMRQQNGTVPTAYPFRVNPLPRDFDSGTFSSSMMEQFSLLSAKLKPRRGTGGSLSLTVFDLRAAAFSARTTVKLHRMIIREGKHSKDGAKRRSDDDRRKVQKEAKTRKNVVKALEHYMKRATRRFLAVRTPDEFRALSKEWQSHLRWIQFHLTYFKSTRIFLSPMRRTYQTSINQLVKMAEKAILVRKYQLPDPASLRHVIRLFVSYSRRARIGQYHHRYMLNNTGNRFAQARLFEFLEPRLYLRNTK